MSKPRLYPLDVTEFSDGNDEPAGFYSKGHHDETVFKTAVIAHIRETNGGPDPEYEGAVALAGMAKDFWRSIHFGTPNSDCVKFLPGIPGQQGVYPVTVVRVDL